VKDASDPLPSDLASAHAMILAQREQLAQKEAENLAAQSEAKITRLEIERLKFLLAKARREQFGQSSERGKQLIEQLELAIEDLEETRGAEAAKAEIAAPEATKEKHRRAPRGPRKLPNDLQVERVVEPAPCACGKCGGARLRKLGEVVTRTLESEPRRWKITEHVREKFTCRDCEAITEPASAFASDCARLCRPQPAGDDPGLKIPAASAAQPPSRDLCPRRRRDRHLHARRLGRRLRGDARSGFGRTESPRPARRAHSRR